MTISLVALGSGSPWGITASQASSVRFQSICWHQQWGLWRVGATEFIELGLPGQEAPGGFPAPGQGKAVKALKFMAWMGFPPCPSLFPRNHLIIFKCWEEMVQERRREGGPLRPGTLPGMQPGPSKVSTPLSGKGGLGQEPCSSTCDPGPSSTGFSREFMRNTKFQAASQMQESEPAF